MDQQQAIQIQAYLDGALSPEERGQIEALLSADAKARELLVSLRQVQGIVAGNELEQKVPDSRVFYWSQLARKLSPTGRSAPTEARLTAILGRWIRLLIPFAAVVVIALGLGWHFHSTSTESELAIARQEIATAADEADAITFYSPEAKMTVVWVDLRGN